MSKDLQKLLEELGIAPPKKNDRGVTDEQMIRDLKNVSRKVRHLAKRIEEGEQPADEGFEFTLLLAAHEKDPDNADKVGCHVMTCASNGFVARALVEMMKGLPEPLLIHVIKELYKEKYGHEWTDNKYAQDILKAVNGDNETIQ